MLRVKAILQAWFCVLLGLVPFSLPWKDRLQAQEPGMLKDASLTFFEQKIRPVLINRCVRCHGPEKQQNGLRLDSRQAMLRGGQSGPALQPGKPDQSLLIHVIQNGEPFSMPPRAKLPTSEIADLVSWIKAGAPWPATEAPAPVRSGATSAGFSPAELSFWAFQKPVKPPIPEVAQRNWVTSPIDCFILAELEKNGLQPAPSADKRTLLRRVTLDLIGLPPTSAELTAFVADSAPDAFAKVVERLLASPHYGERWGRHWLDVARYADSNGMDENLAYVNAFRYRDYVITAFNRDKPYDQFVREQLAGDLLPVPPDSKIPGAQTIATGFLSLGPKMLAEDDPVKMEMDIIDEQVDTVGRAFVGLTLGCARCHHHKFDPIPTEDYYSLAGIFKSTKTMENFKVVAAWNEVHLATRQEAQRKKDYDARVRNAKEAFDKQSKALRDDLAVRAGKEAVRNILRQGLPSPADNLTQAFELLPAVLAWKKIQGNLKTLEQAAPPEYPMAMAVEEGKPANLRVHLRGSHLTLGKEVPRRFLQILGGNEPPLEANHSGRLELASWLTRLDHPLTSRVLVNRVWRGHFGEGLVRTPDNFGKLGERPTNQPLLDWLAVEFVENGWSIKKLHRLLVNSSTYKMSTQYDVRAAARDPENRLQWRMNRRRLDAETLRDALLAVSGMLDRQMFGSLLNFKSREYVAGTASLGKTRYELPRRSIYLPVIRSALYDFFQAFDFPDPSVPNGSRTSTTVAPQALFMMNSDLVAEATRKLAEGLLRQTAANDAERARLAYLQVLGRAPTQLEVERARAFVARAEDALADQNRDAGGRCLAAWQCLCRVLVASNEFVFVE